MQKPLVLLAAILCLFAAPGVHAATPSANTTVSGGINAFACDLYAHLRGKDGNLFFSPLSLSSALAATRAGARGETASQMARTLHLSADMDQTNQGFLRLLGRLNGPQHDKRLHIEIANSLWSQKNFTLHPEYVEMAKNFYGAAANTVDYVNAPAAAADRINAWVAEKTRGRIPRLLEAPDTNTRLILINTIYFKGLWSFPFDRAATKDDIFHAPDKPVRIPFMMRTDSFNYQETQDFQMLELPYADGKFSLFVLLPAATPGALENLEEKLSPQLLTQWIKALTRHKVQVVFPKFKLSWGPATLNEALVSLGMRDAFSQDSADFSGMSAQALNPDTRLFLSDVLHQATLEVDEQGTTATAATGVLVATKSLPLVFRADRPFLFFIRENTGGTILFLGRLTAP